MVAMGMRELALATVGGCAVWPRWRINDLLHPGFDLGELHAQLILASARCCRWVASSNREMVNVNMVPLVFDTINECEGFIVGGDATLGVGGCSGNATHISFVLACLDI